jgi:large conductance mechanosensitive channel
MDKKINSENLKKKGGKTLQEFKDFIAKGNVLDMAVGVIMGSAFGKIVTSVVNDILMPLIGIVIGGVDFTNLSIKIKDVTITYGNFIQNVIDFLIIAACVFVLVKAVNKFTKKKEEPKEEAPKKSAEEVLLEEILKEMKKRK